MTDTDNKYLSVEQIRIAEIEAGRTSYIKNRRAAVANETRGKWYNPPEAKAAKSLNEQEGEEEN